MNDVLSHVLVGLNAAANFVGGVLLAPLTAVPGWLSATIVAAATGVLLLWVFKHTSDQNRVKAARSTISANLFALRLFKDSTPVTLRAQGRVFGGAFRLALLALIPMAVMTLPVLLVLGQLSLWYQHRPLHEGEEAVVTVALNKSAAASNVTLEPAEGVEVLSGPVRVRSKDEVCWNVRATKPGQRSLAIHVGYKAYTKDLAIGTGTMRVSPRRPAWDWADVLMNPAEPPLQPTDAVRAVDIQYPHRADGWASSADSWVIYWFVVSMIAALCFRRALNVNL